MKRSKNSFSMFETISEPVIPPPASVRMKRMYPLLFGLPFPPLRWRPILFLLLLRSFYDGLDFSGCNHFADLVESIDVGLAIQRGVTSAARQDDFLLLLLSLDESAAQAMGESGKDLPGATRVSQFATPNVRVFERSY
jgi:hypothetical protein